MEGWSSSQKLVTDAIYSTIEPTFSAFIQNWRPSSSSSCGGHYNRSLVIITSCVDLVLNPDTFPIPETDLNFTLPPYKYKDSNAPTVIMSMGINKWNDFQTGKFRFYGHIITLLNEKLREIHKDLPLWRIVWKEYHSSDTIAIYLDLKEDEEGTKSSGWFF